MPVAFALDGGSGTGTFGAVTDNGNGTYSATFTATAAGTGVISATIGGSTVASTLNVNLAVLISVADPEFATPSQHGGATYDTAGSPWTFTGQAGISADGSGFGNSGSLSGQAAFLQQMGTASQIINFSTAGSYAIIFSAVQRIVSGKSQAQTIVVSVDGTTVGHHHADRDHLCQLQHAAFTVTAGNHTIKFAGTNPSGGDNTAFIDQVVIGSGLADLSFETPVQSAGAYASDPSGSPWAFNGLAGVASNGSP